MALSSAEPRVLVIEDIRTFRFPATYARTLHEAWVLLLDGPWDELWLDYDLGLTRDSDNTYVLAEYMERRAHEGAALPIGKVVVHSANPYGGDRLMAALSGWYPTQRVSCLDYLVPGSADE